MNMENLGLEVGKIMSDPIIFPHFRKEEVTKLEMDGITFKPTMHCAP